MSTAQSDIDKLLEDAVRDIGIPPRPAVLQQVDAEMAREEPDPGRLARILSADVSLSAGLMRIANSPFFGARSRARSVSQALLLLGMDVACRAATGLVLRNLFPRSAPLERFWDASARVAQLSGWLAARLHPAGVAAADAYCFGLFRDCGIAVMIRKFPDYQKTLQLANAEPLRSFTAIEMERHPTNHAVVGCLLARTWWLPETSCLAIRHHHDVAAVAAGPIALPAETAALIALAQFSEHVIQLAFNLSRTCEWEKLGPLCLGVLGVAPEDEAALVEAASQLARNEE